MRLRVVRRRLPLLAIALTAAVAFPLGVVASHQFTDVPNTNSFHADIDALADAGVTTGCAAGKYCPKDFVTREQMAAFLNRLGALGPGKSPVVNADKVDGLNSTQFARSDVNTPGVTSCTRSSMRPSYSDTEYLTNGAFISPTAGENWFVCQLHLPDGATMTSFTGHLQDDSTTSYAQCELYRSGLATGSLDSIAAPPATSTPGTDHNAVVSTTTIEPPTVDNSAYSYWAECGALEYGATGIHGVQVTYLIAGLPIE